MPISHEISTPVLKEDMERVLKDAEQMLFICEYNLTGNDRPVIALSHCEVARKSLTFFVIDSPKERYSFDYNIIINPKITERQKEYSIKEICPSFPYLNETRVKRHKTIKVEFRDKDFNKHTMYIDGRLAQIFEHQIEHFNAIYPYDIQNNTNDKKKRRG